MNSWNVLNFPFTKTNIEKGWNIWVQIREQQTLSAVNDVFIFPTSKEDCIKLLEEAILSYDINQKEHYLNAALNFFRILWDLSQFFSEKTWITFNSFCRNFPFTKLLLSSKQKNEHVLDAKILILSIFLVEELSIIIFSEVNDEFKIYLSDLVSTFDPQKDVVESELFLLVEWNKYLSQYWIEFTKELREFIPWFLEESIILFMKTETSKLKKWSFMSLLRGEVFKNQYDVSRKKEELKSFVSNLNFSWGPYLIHFYSVPTKSKNVVVFQNQRFFKKSSQDFAIFDLDREWFLKEVDNLFSEYENLALDWWMFSFSIFKKDWNTTHDNFNNLAANDNNFQDFRMSA